MIMSYNITDCIHRTNRQIMEKNLIVVTVREADLGDCIEVFEWRNDDLTRQMSRSSNVVHWEDHLRWYENSLANEDRLLLICESKGEVKNCKLGIVRFEFIDGASKAEISINLSPSKRGRGYAKVCLKKSISYMADTKPMCESIIAETKKINWASKRSFEQVGFNLVSEDSLFWQYELHYPRVC